ncbi:MAG: CocE/NonD family hydrolase [Acidimicrobiia bacterium]
MSGHETYPVRIDRRVFVPMDDGVRIALTLYLPDAPGDGPFPAVIESLPYRKDDDCTARDFSTFTYLAQRGIAGIRIDIRGTGASTGVILDEYTPQEQADNVSIMNWAECQDWCDGNLGMWGISWGGFSALQTAMLRPSQLKAIAPMHATHDRFACDVHYTGGSLHAAEQVDWPPSMVTSNALPPDPDIVGEVWFEEWMKRLESTPQWPLEWLSHQKRDDYWRHGSPCTDYSAIECPTLLIGGWLDGYVDGMLAMAENLSCPTRTVIGPWGHYRPATGVPRPTFDHFDLLARWFGHHLRGDANGVMDMPALTVFVRTDHPTDGEEVAGYWRAEGGWPPADRTLWSADLSDMTNVSTSWNGPQWVGSHAPAWDRAGVTSNDPGLDDEVSMAFTTRPFGEPLEILGTPQVELTVTSDVDVGMVAARLLAVSPTGLTHLICRGSRNLSFPNDLSSPLAPKPGLPMTISFPLLATSALIPIGWSLRLSLSGADFPVVWPPKKKFTLTVDPSQSRIVLPTVPQRDTVTTLTFEDSPPPIEPPVEVIESNATWEVVRGNDKTMLRRTVLHAELQPVRDNLRYSSHQHWVVEVADDDTSSTRVFSESTLGLSRPEWDVGTTGTVEITGDESLHIAIDLAATYNGEEVFRRSWRGDIAREWA